MINMTFLYGAYAIIFIVLFNEFLKKCFHVDLQKIDAGTLLKIFNRNAVISRNTGDKSLKLLSAGENKITVMATLRNITGLDYKSAKSIVDHTPNVFMKGISYKEANLTKKALEFVGASIEIK